MSSHLAAGPFKMNIWEGKARDKFISLIEELEGTKAIIWDNELIGPVNLLATHSRLRELGVERVLLLKSDFVANLDVKHVIFITRPRLYQLDLLSEYARGLANEDQHLNYTKEMRVIFIPRITEMCYRRLKERGVLGSLELKSLDFDLFPFDTDLMSMERENSFCEFEIEKDPTCLMDAALALRSLESDYGPIPHINGRGPAAKIFVDYFSMLKRQDKKKQMLGSSTFQDVIVIDRKVDLISPLATQLTYEGLIDEMFNVNSTTVAFPAERFSKEEEPEGFTTNSKKIVMLNSSDELYAELRDKNFNGIGPALMKRAHSVASQMEQRHSNSIETMRTFVNQLPQLLASKKALAIHTTIAELIRDMTQQGSFLESLEAEQDLLSGRDTDRLIPFLEDAISRKKPLINVLRLLCLQSLVNGGLRHKNLEHYKRELIQTYGLQILTPLNNLEKAGLMCPQSASRHYITLKKMLHLIIEDDSETDPSDICYTHSIYAPLSVRLIQNYKSWKDMIEMVPGPSIDETFDHVNDWKRSDRSLVLVFFLGGCTYAEVSALRFLSQKEDSKVDYIIATTKLINGNTFLKSIMTNSANYDFSLFN